MTMLTDTLNIGIEVRRSPSWGALRSLDSSICPPAGLWSTGVSPLLTLERMIPFKVQSRFSSLCLTGEA